MLKDLILKLKYFFLCFLWFFSQKIFFYLVYLKFLGLVLKFDLSFLDFFLLSFVEADV